MALFRDGGAGESSSLYQRMWAVFALAVVLCVAAGGVAARALDRGPVYDATLASWIDSVDRSKLEPTVNDLTGETSPLIGGSPFTILTRYSRSGAPADMAEQYVYEHLLSYGLTSVGYQSFVRDGVAYRNVVAEIVGTRHPSEIVLVGAHLDSQSGARARPWLRGPTTTHRAWRRRSTWPRCSPIKQFDRTVRFVFFDGEEQDYIGSIYHVNQATAAGENIVAMLSPDMLAYNAGSGVLYLHTRVPGAAGEPADRAIAQLCIDVASIYSITGVKPTLSPTARTTATTGPFGTPATRRSRWRRTWTSTIHASTRPMTRSLGSTGRTTSAP